MLSVIKIKKMEQNTSKVGATSAESTGKVEIKGKRFGRGAVESGLTCECGVFGVVATGKWPTTVSLNLFDVEMFLTKFLFQG